MESKENITVYETVSVGIEPVKKDQKYLLIYKPDFIDPKDKKIINPSVARYRKEGEYYDRIQFNGSDKGKRQYRHTSRQIPSDFELSGGELKGERYQIIYKGNNPGSYI